MPYWLRVTLGLLFAVLVGALVSWGLCSVELAEKPDTLGWVMVFLAITCFVLGGTMGAMAADAAGAFSIPEPID